jgi:hypothetical protein
MHKYVGTEASFTNRQAILHWYAAFLPHFSRNPWPNDPGEITNNLKELSG